MKIRCLLVLGMLCALLTGCSVVGLEPQGLMQPPRATGDKQNVYDALEQVAQNQNFALKYPRTGDYRSAIIMHPVSDPERDDAIALYQVKDGETAGIRITFFSKRGSVWTDVGTYQSSASQVDRVAFGDLNGDGRDEVVLGWGNGVTSLAELSVYVFDPASGTIREVTSGDTSVRQFYNEFVLVDLDNDGTQDIFTASLGTAEHPANGKLLSLSKEEKLEVLSSVNLERDVIQYSHVSTGKVDAQTNGLLLDGTTSSSQMLTELIYWDASQQVLRSPFASEETSPPAAHSPANPTIRKAPVYSALRGDPPLLQFPMLELLPGYPADEQDPDAFLTHWYHYDTKTGTTVQDDVQYLNFTNRYAFTIPQSWLKTVTAQVGEDRQSVTFYQWEKAAGQTGSRGDALLKLQAVPRESWGSLEQDASVFLLLEMGDVRLYAFSPNPANPLSLTPEQLRLQVSPFLQNP